MIEKRELKKQGPFEVNQVVRIWGGGPIGIITKLGLFHHPEDKGVFGENCYTVYLIHLDFESHYSEFELERY